MAARITRQPLEALGWLNTFIIYIALPALFFQAVVQDAGGATGKLGVHRLQHPGDLCDFHLHLCAGACRKPRQHAEGTIQGLRVAYGNIGYMGPAIAILALGEKAAIPVAIIFCFENILHFALAPALIAVSGKQKQSAASLIVDVVRKILFHPFIIATAVGVGFAILEWPVPVPLQTPD